MHIWNLVIIGLLNFNIFFAQLPYSDLQSVHSKSSTNGMVNMIDDLGYKFFGVTDSIMNEDLTTKFQSSKLKLLLKTSYEVSEVMIQTIQENKDNISLHTAPISYYELRRNTLFNLNRLSVAFNKNNSNILEYPNLLSITKSIRLLNSLCDEIISYRRSLGIPYIPKIQSKKQDESSATIFNQKRGADGLTHEQWMLIMEGGGGKQAPDIIRLTNRENQKEYIKLKKQNRDIVEAGGIQEIKTFTNFVNGDIYIYRNFPPEQLSIFYSSDNELIKGLVNWILYINAGNNTELSNIFRVTTNENFERNKNQLMSFQFNRKVEDANQNQITVEFYPKNIKISDMTIEQVRMDENSIDFLGQINNTKLEDGLRPLLKIRTVNGDLLNRMKLNVNQMREGLHNYNESIMNLNKY